MSLRDGVTSHSVSRLSVKCERDEGKRRKEGTGGSVFQCCNIPEAGEDRPSGGFMVPFFLFFSFLFLPPGLFSGSYCRKTKGRDVVQTRSWRCSHLQGFAEQEQALICWA